MVKNIVLHDRRKLVKVSKDFEASGPEAHRTAPYTPQGNGRVEHMSSTIRIGILTLLTRAGTRASFWAECLYDDGELHNCVTRLGCTRISEEHLAGMS